MLCIGLGSWIHIVAPPGVLIVPSTAGPVLHGGHALLERSSSVSAVDVCSLPLPSALTAIVDSPGHMRLGWLDVMNSLRLLTLRKTWAYRRTRYPKWQNSISCFSETRGICCCRRMPFGRPSGVQNNGEVRCVLGILGRVFGHLGTVKRDGDLHNGSMSFNLFLNLYWPCHFTRLNA